MAYQINDKKKALLASKDEILRDIKYFENRIEEARSHKTNSSYYYDDDDDSDSEMFSLDMGPSVPDLKLEQGRLQTCLHATQELTNLYVLQSEVNVLVNDPVYEREPAVADQGTWREVTADCRVDLVPFSITFYAHQSSRLFGPTSYRGLRVSPVKTAHENELAKSILPHVRTPSDAVEVLRSYAAAHRSRRTTLARLAEKYSNSLFMEPMEDGGYIMKCVNLLEVSWTLENKWSPVAPFHHRMKFDLEYMDEMYVKIISQAHRELSDPTLETDERTRLMSKIIATCLEAQGPTQELYESMESDVDTENLRNRRTTLDEELEEPINKKKKDSEIMAPPKSLPKKIKLKGKENNAANKKVSKSVKRPVKDDGNDGAKKAKLSHNNLVKSCNANTEKNIDKEITSTVVDDKINNVRKNIASMANIENEVVKPNNEKNSAKIKDSHKDITMKNTNYNTKGRTDKENVTTQKKGTENKAGNKNVAGSSKLDNAKNTDINVKINSKKSKNVKESTASTKNIDKQDLKGQVVHENTVQNVGDAKNSKKPVVNTKKTNKMSDNIPNKETTNYSNEDNNKVKINKPLKSTEKTKSGASKSTTTKPITVESITQNKNEQTKKSKVSSQTNIASKAEHLNNDAMVSNKQNNPKTTSTGPVNKIVTKLDDALNLDNVTNKKGVPKVKSIERSKTNPPLSNLENLNTKNNLGSTKNINSVERDVNTNSSDKVVPTKSKKNINDKVITKSSAQSSEQELVTKDNKSKHSVKNVPEKENTKHLNKQTPAISANIKKPKSNINTDKKGNEHNSAPTQLKQDEPQSKLAKNANSKTTDSRKEHYKTNKNIGNINTVVDKKVSSKNTKLPNLNETYTNEVNDNAGRNVLKQKNSTNNQVFNANDNTVKSKPLKLKLNAKNTVKNVINPKNLRSSKSPVQKNRMSLLNPRNKMAMDKLKVTNKQKENDADKKKHVLNKVFTKIPQKLMSVREHIIKKNPLRISPRKTQFNLKTDSQNSSRSSQKSLQKPITGIPRLMKKPIRKE